jgi:hypothetical protein
MSQQSTLSIKNQFISGMVFGLGYFVLGLWWIYISLHDIGGMHAAVSCLAVFLLAAGMALLSNAKKEATADTPQMAKGGIEPASPGGTLVNVGEVGSAEAIVPLNSPKAAGMLGGGDNPGLMTAINELRNAVNALANKPQPAMAIQVGAEKLGEVVGRQAETGTNQYKNAYRLA